MSSTDNWSLSIDRNTQFLIVGCAFGVITTFTIVLIYLICKKFTSKKVDDDVANGDLSHVLNPFHVGDRKLAQSAQMFHFQHQKQQLIAAESAYNEKPPLDPNDILDCDLSPGEDDTVYECPGLANLQQSNFDIENPMFDKMTFTPNTTSNENN